MAFVLAGVVVILMVIAGILHEHSGKLTACKQQLKRIADALEKNDREAK